VLCSFPALVLGDELQRGLAARGWRLEWAALAAVEVRGGEHWDLLRPALQGGLAKCCKRPAAPSHHRFVPCRRWCQAQKLPVSLRDCKALPSVNCRSSA
jgi:hypothetical protein